MPGPLPVFGKTFSGSATLCVSYVIFQVCLVAEVVFGKSRRDLPFVCIILALVQILVRVLDPVLHCITVTLELPGI